MAIYSENVSELAQMTLNERFYARDLIELWDDAVERGDRTAIIALLARVELGDQAEAVADAVLGTRS